LQKSTEFSRRRKNKALLFLKELCAENIVSHSISVSKKAREIADKIKASGHDIDSDFVEIGAILHDIGRSKSHGIDHGIKGSEILRNSEFSEFARVCETHLCAGIDRKEAASIGLPAKDYIPETLEEKVIAHADNLTAHKDHVPISETIEKIENELGKEHPAIRRIKDLDDFINSLL